MDITKPRAGHPFDVALQALQVDNTLSGLGFIFKGDGLVGIDMDDCIQNGQVHPSALELLRSANCGYVEISPSGQGLHGIGRCPELSQDIKSKRIFDGYGVEVYKCNSYFTITANLLPDIKGNAELREMPMLEGIVRHILGVPTQETQVTQVSQVTQVTEETKDKQDGGGGLNNVLSTLPSNCIPTQFGQRNAALFQLARYLRGVAANASKEALYDVVFQWFNRYEAVIRTKDFGVTWATFELAWKNIKTPYGETLRGIISNPLPLPNWMNGHRYGQRADQLLRICVTLAEHHDPEPFFLSCRTAQQLTGIDFSDCAKLFKVFVNQGFLVPHESNPEPGKVPVKGGVRQAHQYCIGSPDKAGGKQE
jgi:hypothetical protein